MATESLPKQRLVGIGLLMLLIFIVAIILINSAKDNLEPELQTVDDKPFASLVEPIDSIETEQEASLELEGQQIDSEANEAKAPIKEEKPTPKLQATPKQTLADQKLAEIERKLNNSVSSKQEAWVVQLASFSVQANANSLAQKVEKLHYKVNIEPKKSGSKTIYRVRLLPESDKSVAQQNAAKLKQQLKLTPQVIKSTH
jgi:DedD protein